ncbi:MAG: EAL domain-containing protein [Pseudobutyrivibrio sp.]|uniref:EAL domain-containing protein n=1 Tax=Pseudobutyrivibrio sp. TaxID=2014367 RepID=UPI0025D343F7|nr:EAL domain-containing protein [Pseudobutyrivibrio sp.]MBE5903928.1 EAL domain-containing protein [Pseudobutyrivibrio sp.]
MWDYSYVIPSILILCILLFYYFTLKRLPIRINRGFVALLVTEVVVIGSDILASYADEKYKELPYNLVVWLNILYFIAFIVRIKMFDTITCNVFSINPYEDKIGSFIKNIPIILTTIVIISSYWTGSVFSITENGYVRGPYYDIIYFPYIWYLALAIYYIARYKNQIKRKRDLVCVIVYTDLIIIGLAIRILLPQVLLFDTFCVMSVIIINLVFMNPEFYIDKRTNLFNSEALHEMLREKHTMRDHYILGFVIKNYNEAREIYGPRQMDEGIYLIGSYLIKAFPYLKMFYYRNGRFVLVGKDQEKLIEAKDKIVERFRGRWFSKNTELYLEVGTALGTIDIEEYDSELLITTIISVLNKLGGDSSNYEVEIDDKTIEENRKMIEVRRCLEIAIAQNRTEVFLQPIVDATTHKVIGAEALCRIRDNDGKIISPGLFIPIAERNGHITALGEQMFEKACKFVSENNIEQYGMEWVNVNVSTIQFMQHNLADRFEEILKKYKLSPEVIHLELTEAAMVEENLMDSQIRNLQEKGFYLVVDDYGTGHSNISRIKKYPFINIKLDMSLVWDYVKKPGVIVPRMVQAFKETGYTVTAEGIETKEMAIALKECGCNYLQGMLFSMPIPVDEFLEYVKNY